MNLRTKAHVLFFEETWFFWNNLDLAKKKIHRIYKGHFNEFYLLPQSAELRTFQYISVTLWGFFSISFFFYVVGRMGGGGSIACSLMQDLSIFNKQYATATCAG